MSSKKVILKPHHFLDIIKLHGAGYEKFVPNLEYRHDFYRIGNIVLEDHEAKVELTVSSDDICAPCKYLKNGKCDDFTFSHPVFPSKEKLNETIDRRLLTIIGLEEGVEISAIEFCKLAKEKISKEKIREVWKEQPVEITNKRVTFLLSGINKYIENYSKKRVV